MEAFRTPIPVQSSPARLTQFSPVLLMGSCFTEHIGRQLAERKFNILQNPFGIVYNPISLAGGLEQLMQGNQPPDASQLFEHQGLWHSWDHHSRFSGPNREETLEGMQNAYYQAADFIQKATCLIITFGTSEVSVLRKEGRVVANNHKMPASWFEHGRLSVEEILEVWVPILEKWADRQVILTVSPVRHLRNGLVENQRSKARLILACEEICRAFPFASYFPSYELLMDDLRDYRFYEPDMIHPSSLAVDYIWQHFSETYMDVATRQLNERVMKINAAMKHRPFHAETPEHLAFMQAQLSRVMDLEREFPRLNWTVEKAFFSRPV
jgi:hypothetical protein